MGTYTIGEVAERSGFSASALRYYEGIGLVPVPARTASGYRRYDDRVLARLGFIARAKQLGCSLEEVTDLLSIWDGERCGPVQRRFHELVTDKVQRTEQQRRELTAFAAQLQEAAGQLAAAVPVDGPCGAGCACTAPLTIERRSPTPEVAIACSLDPQAVPDQMAAWHAVLAGATAPTASPDGTRRVVLAGDVDLAALARLVAAEQRCCAFLSFAITADDRGLGLEVRGPAAAADVVDALLAVAA
jgi:MerR family copper efflux transcriptional regulator